ncbi:MAG: hypothetical protein H7255_15040 [Ramlibacter sp.]|nr:hypothetical protein [Ramlibacter sp.]
MATPIAKTIDDATRDIPFWLILGTLVVAQITAFWMLCSQQVQKAQARDGVVQQRQALASECPNYASGLSQPTCGRDRTGGPNTLAVSYVR